jgi:hypothetical protein
MSNTLDRFKAELDALAKLATRMEHALLHQSPEHSKSLTKEEKAEVAKFPRLFESSYQRWFTEASAVVRQLVPERSSEFQSYYLTDPKRKHINIQTFSIQDWLVGARSATDFAGQKNFDDHAAVVMRFHTQHQILAAASARFESSLLDIRQVLQADLFDSELDMARELLKKGFLRPAGVIAGVVLERHLSEVCRTHGALPKKKDPGIGDLNDALKANGTIEVPLWRTIQRLGDLRNLAAHNKEREPSRAEMFELIDGADRLLKTVN